MSNNQNTVLLEGAYADFATAIEGGDWEEATAVINELRDAGFADESFKLANEFLLAKREFISEPEIDDSPEGIKEAMDVRDSNDRAGYPF